LFRNVWPERQLLQRKMGQFGTERCDIIINLPDAQSGLRNIQQTEPRPLE